MRARRGTRVGVRMLAIAFVPLLAAGVLAAGEYDRRVEVAAQADRSIDDVDAISSEFALHAASLAERVPTEAIAASARLGLATDEASRLLGVDLPTELTAARARFDALIADAPNALQREHLGALEDLRARLDSPELSQRPSVDEVRMLFDTMQATSAASLVGRTAELGATWGVMSGGPVRAQQIAFQRASNVFTQGTWQVEWLAALLVRGQQEPEETVQRLRASTTLYEEALRGMEPTLGPRAAAAWADARGYDELMSPFATALRAALLSGGDRVPEFSIDHLGLIFRDAFDRMHAQQAFAEATTADLRTTLVELHDEANAAQTRFLLLAVGVLALTILLLLLTARGIVTPLRRLERRAHELRDGRLDGDVLPIAGPSEVRVVTAAFNEAVANLQRVDEVAGALAAGDLSPGALRTVPGGIGESLRGAVERLSRSLREREDLEHRLRHQANHDHLTGLMNRRGMESFLDDRARDATAPSVALLFVDLDGFKRINDSSGHRAGDMVLRIVAKRLERALPDALALCRFGGDQWVAVLDDAALDRTVASVRRVMEAVREPLIAEGRRFSLVASVGVAFTESDESARTTIRNADLALSDARRVRPGSFRVYDESLRDSVLDRLATERELAEALRRSQLLVHYQPVVDAVDGRLRGVEALVRWPDRFGALRPPDKFVPVAETSDLIVELDRFVLGRAAADVAEWRRIPGFEDLHLAVNISGRHLLANGFVNAVLDIVDLAGLTPSALVLEITETVLLDDLDVAAHNLNLLRDCGVRVAIDDFGTGYTSVHQLRSLPADTLKIDRSLIEEGSLAERVALVSLIVDVGRSLSLEVLAEGVETDEQLGLVREAGCNLVQGWLTGRPMPKAQVEETLLTPLAAGGYHPPA